MAWRVVCRHFEAFCDPVKQGSQKHAAYKNATSDLKH